MSLEEDVDRIKKVIDEGYAGRRDENTLNTINREVKLILLRKDLPARAAGKLPELLKWADVYFSPRKHLGYPGGLDQIYSWMMEALDSARSQRLPEK